MNVLVYASDMGSQDPRLADMQVGEEYIRRYSKYGGLYLRGGYEYATLQRVSDGRVFRVRAEKLNDHFELKREENESSL